MDEEDAGADEDSVENPGGGALVDLGFFECAEAYDEAADDESAEVTEEAFDHFQGDVGGALLEVEACGDVDDDCAEGDCA